jgi:predicted O-methyltransferase YrrM
MSSLDIDAVARAAQAELGGWRTRVAGLPYERKGVLYSEIFFLYLCARTMRPARILESGRARGQSTALLALSFPEAAIVSFEHDARSPDAAVAAARLTPYRNVELRFGDATRELPAIARPGDVVLIDGPKGFRALRLALRLLARCGVAMAFLHDMTPGTPERRFLERRLPATLYSDDRRFAEVAHSLDAAAGEIPEQHRWRGRDGYGYSLACLQRRPDERYWTAWLGAVLAGVARRA